MADSIKVNAGQWNAASKAEQDRIREIMTATGLMQEGVIITPDAATPALDPEIHINPGKLCEKVCDGAEGVAAGACYVHTAGLGLVACLAAAKAVGDACRRHCHH